MSKYLIIYFRNLRKEKTKVLNIFSIALTLTFALLVLFFIVDELSYDIWNKNLYNTYRISTSKKWPAKEFNKATTTFSTGPALKNEFHEIKSYVRFLKIRNPEISIKNKKFSEEKFFFTDSSFLEIFPYKLLLGSQNDALSSPNSIIISEYLSNKYYGEEDPLGKTIAVNGIDYIITGVIDNSSKSHLVFNALLSMQPLTNLHQLQESDFKSASILSWGEETAYTYLLLNRDVNIDLLNSKILSYYDQFSDKEGGYFYSISLQPLAGIHFNDKKLENDFPTMNKKYIYVFVALLIIVLIFSVINYINLVVGNSLKTTKYIGINKLFGMRNKQILAFFVSDSLLNTIFSFIISIALLLFVIPYYNQFFNKDLSLNIFANIPILKAVLILLAFIGIVPGLVLGALFIPMSSFSTLKNQFIKRNVFIRRVFVFLEVSLLVFVVFGILLVNYQLHELKNNNLGFHEKNIVVIHIKNPDLVKNASIFKDKIRKLSNVFDVAASDAGVGDDYWIASFRTEIDGQREMFDLKRIVVDENFTNLYGFEFVEGRNFDKENRTDFNNCIINEAVINKLNFKRNPINKRIQLSGRKEGVIIGVVKNFYFGSKHNEIEPLIICLSDKGTYTSEISVKIAPTAIQNTVQELNNLWNAFSSNDAFNYTFVEDEISSFYTSEERLIMVFKWGTALSLLIVSFGLICFAFFIIEQKIKEIGIRKVNGASSFRIAKDILKMELAIPSFVALMIVLPFSHFIIKGFLQTIVVRVSIHWWIYGLTVFIILFILVLTTFYQLYKAANKNPAEALSSE